ncbi:MAG TPA: M23 family metallopeptidase [Bryobacteraceae bacterium]|nr:M23 family metallopeptidase [Bryobacteraceae bacterium]
MKVALLAVLIMVVIAFPVSLFSWSTWTTITVDPPVKIIGFQTPVRIHLDNSHGERTVKVDLEQDGKTYNLSTEVQPAKHFVFSHGNAAPRDLTVKAGKQAVPALHDGKAQILVTATSNDFRGVTTSKTIDVDVMTVAPRVTTDGAQHYINQGGSEMAVFTPTGAWTEAGVKVGDYTFRSFPLPNHPGQYFSLFAFSWQLPVDTPVYVYASNPSGAMAKTTFWYKVFPKKFRASTIPLETMNIDRIVNQIDTQNKIKGDLVERFVYINSQMRKVNNKTLADLRLQTEPKFLWTGAFLPMLDSTVESRYADDRTYTWKGKKVDEQTHLGFDLAKVAHSPVPASNDGKVIWAEDLGIYGNCIVLDHGYGLQTVYGHLSEFLVKKGDMVKKGQIIARTGSTGLAGGDHLHFTMQIDGVQVNPVEWWDPHWVKDRILSKMGTEMATSEEAAPVHAAAPRKAKKRRR